MYNWVDKLFKAPTNVAGRLLKEAGEDISGFVNTVIKGGNAFRTNDVETLKEVYTPKQPTQASQQGITPLEPVTKYIPYDAMPARPIGYSYDTDDSWKLAVVDNKSVSNGYADTAYGFRVVSADDEHDGQVVAVNQYGDVRYLEDEQDMSEDWKEKLYGFKEEYTQAKTTFDVYYKIQEHAKAGEEFYTIDINDPYQANSIMDLVANVLGDAGPSLLGPLFNSVKRMNQIQADSDKMLKSVYEYGMRSTPGKVLTNIGIEAVLGEDWKEQLSGSPEALQKLLDADLPEEVKNYMAYQIVTGDDKLDLGNALNEVFTNLGESMDWLANPIKAGVQWVDDNSPVQLWDLNKDLDLSNKGFLETLGESYAPTYSESGRAQYDYNTGWFLSDMLLEVFSDPTTLLTLGTSAVASPAAKAGTKAVVSELGEEVVSETLERTMYKNLKSLIKAGAKEGLTEDAIIKRFALRHADIMTEPVQATLKSALEYGKSMSIVRSLEATSKAIDKVDELMAFTSQLVGPLGPVIGSAGIVRKVLSIPQAAKAAQDAYKEVEIPDHGINVFNINDWVDTHNTKILGLNAYEGDKVLQYIPKEARADLIKHTYVRTVDMLKNTLVGAKDLRKFNATLETISGGKIHNLEELAKFIDSLRTGDEDLDSVLITNLHELVYMVDHVTKESFYAELHKVKEAFDKIQETVQAVKQIEYHTYFEDNLKHTKYKDYLKENKGKYSFVNILRFKDFARHKEQLARAKWMKDELDIYKDGHTLKEFFDALHQAKQRSKSVPTLAEYLEDRGVSKEVLKFKEWQKEFAPTIKIPKLDDFLKEFGASKDLLKFKEWQKKYTATEKIPKLKEYLEAHGATKDMLSFKGWQEVYGKSKSYITFDEFFKTQNVADVTDLVAVREQYDLYTRAIKEYNEDLYTRYREMVNSWLESYYAHVAEVKMFNDAVYVEYRKTVSSWLAKYDAHVKPIKAHNDAVFRQYRTMVDSWMSEYKKLTEGIRLNNIAVFTNTLAPLRESLKGITQTYLGKDSVLEELLEKDALTPKQVDYIINKLEYIQYLYCAKAHNDATMKTLHDTYKYEQDKIAEAKNYIHAANRAIYQAKFDSYLGSVEHDLIQWVQQLVPDDRHVHQRIAEIASKKDLYKLLDFCRAAMDYANAKAYQSFRGPYTILPERELHLYTEAVLKEHADKFAQRVKEAAPKNLLGGDEVRQYVVQLSKRARADHLVADDELMSLLLSTTDSSTNLYDLIHVLLSSDNNNYRSMAREVLSAAYSTKSYIALTDALAKAKYIPEYMHNGIIDHWFSDAAYLKHPFRGKNSYAITPEYIYSRARSIAQSSVKHMLREMNMRYSDSFMSLFDRNCNTIDTVANVHAIKAQFQKYVDFDDTHKVPIFYSVNFYGESGNITELTLMMDDVVKTFKYDYNPATHRDDMQYMFAEVQAWIDEQRDTIKHKGKFTQFVGFNNHNTSVLDTDYRLGQQIKLFNGGITLGDTIDVAEYVRIRDLNAPVIPQNTVEELTEIYNKHLTEYYCTAYQMDHNISGGMVPKIDAYTLDRLPKIKQRHTRSGGEIFSVMRELERMRARMLVKFKEVGELQTALQKDVGTITVDSHYNIMSLVKEANEDAPYEIFNVHKVMDESTVKQYFNIDGLDKYPSELFYDFAKDAKDIVQSIKDPSVLHQFVQEKPDELYNMYVFLTSSTVFGVEHRDMLNALQPFREMNPVKQYGVLHALYNHTSAAEHKQFRICFATQLEDGKVIETNADLITSPETYLGVRVGLNDAPSIANVYRELRGSGNDPNSLLNRPGEFMLQLERSEERLRNTFGYITAREEALRAHGAQDSAEYVTLQYQAHIAERFQAFISRVQSMVESANESILTRRLSLDTLQTRRYDTTVRDGYTRVSRQFMDAALERDKKRLKYISSQDQLTFEKHLLKDCNGRMVIDTRYTALNANDIDNLMRLVDETPNANYMLVEDRFIAIWYDCSSFKQEDYNLMSQALSEFSLPRVRVAPKNLDPEHINMLEEIDALLSESGPASLTYGMFHAVDTNAVKYMDAKFFQGVEEQLMPHQIVVQMDNIGKPNCMYHGDISVLSHSSELFLSNDMFVNMSNVFGKIVDASHNRGDILRFTFSKENNFQTFVRNVNTYDNVQGRKAIRDYIDKNGYGVYTLGFRNNKYVIEKLDISTSKGWNAAYNGKNVAILRADTMHQLAKWANSENLVLNGVQEQCKLMQIWNTVIRPAYMTSYLYMKQATFIRNIVDSSFKALNYEGPSHLTYTVEANKALSLYNKWEKEIIDKFQKVKDDTIVKYFTEYDTLEHMKMFNDIRIFFKDPTSGTMLEHLRSMMMSDPQSALKSVLNMDLTKEQLKQVIEIFDSVRKEVGTDTSLNIGMGKAYARLAELYDTEDAFRIARTYAKYIEATKHQKGWNISKIPGLGKMLEFNSNAFGRVEQVNRLAIFLKHLDEGHNPGMASRAISLTQFDYSKSDLMKTVEQIAPFSTFKFYNYEYWLLNAYKFRYFSPFAGTLATMEAEMYSDAIELNQDYWSEDAMEYRAVLTEFLDEMDFADEEKKYVYDALTDYKGLDTFDALGYGWVKVGDRVFFKAGLSMIDAFSTLGIVTGDVEFALDQSGDEEYKSMLQKVGTSLLGYTYDMLFQPIKAITGWLAEAAVGNVSYDDFDDWFVHHAYDFASLIPIIGSIYYSLYSAERNYLSDGHPLTFLMPSLFGMRDTSTYSDNLAKSSLYEYLSRPVGYDWYNQSEAYKQTHRFIMGVSYVPAWLGKDPASWIDNRGRLMQLGFTSEQIQEFYELGGNWWFTEEGDGYKLHNYQLMIGNEELWNEVFNALVNNYGWTPERALALMNEAAVPMWNNQGQYTTGYNLSRVKYGYAGGRNGVRVYNSKAITRLLKNYNRAPKGSKFLSAGLGVSGGSVRRAGNKTPYVRSGGTPYYRNNVHKSYTIWRKRYRNIYKDNYAKYGASRMAMEQNLRNYSNRSITEMRRTNQNIRYGRIRQRRNRY